ncbi:transcription factor bHLH110 isoform X1 [Olea europaea subsp. europaea]|uniref:Transcription factor bHLH110 isoform X1 n=1 Tax=Olea europaea subsp. europaea TaxID=158383 RepID=A0A8S0ULG0_OLEEU|nr:transcription factor bHLH110 isoform X1 [Olea europaea subsp. europaea]
MDSANIHRLKKHHPQDHHQVVGSSSLATSCYGVAGTHSWTPNTILNSDCFNSYPIEGIINPRQAQQNQNPLSSWNISMTPEMELFHWANPTGNLQSGRIKEEFPDNFNPKFTEILNRQSSSIEDFRVNPSSYSKNNELRDFPFNDLRAKLLLRTLSSGNLGNGQNISPQNFYSNSLSTGINGSTQSGRGSCQIFPSINVSNFNLQSTQLENSGNMDMNLQALDHLTASKFHGNFMSPNSQNELGHYKEGLCYGLDYMQQSSQMSMNCPNKISPLSNGVAEAKRSNSILEPKAPKKSRIEPRTSCPPLKVRKEKLGDRIAALQQLVAPFGKTDTASVLMEATGYIKFLQNQVETLSVPYMKSSRNKTSRATKGVSTDDENEEPKRDLRSRGLCLVPLSSLSYITDGVGGAVWPQPHFN